MGTSLFYPRLPRFFFYSATRWDASLPCQSPALSPGTTSRARRLPATLVCRPHRPLPLLSLTRTLSREQHYAQATTGECSGVATLRFSLGFLASSSDNQCITSFRAGALARLATLWSPANLAQGDPQPNHLPGKLLSVLAITRKSTHGEDIHPSGARALAAFLGPTPLSQCPSSGRSQTDCYTLWAASHLCLCLWFRSARRSLTSTSRHSFCSLPQGRLT